MSKTIDSVYSLDEVKALLRPVFEKYGLKKAAVFGSYARNTANHGSDIDILVHFDDSFELDKYLRFEADLKRALKKKVDILDFRCISPALREDVLREAIEIYEYERQENTINNPGGH